MKFKLPRSKYHILSSLFIACLIFLLNFESLIQLKPLRSIDQKIIDAYLTRRGILKNQDSLDVIILGLSNETFQELPEPYNTWPLARNLFAKVIENLNRAGAKVIGIDLLFSEKDKFSYENDSLLFHTIKKFRNVVLAGKLEQVDWRYQVEEAKEINFGNIFYDADSSIGIVNVLPDDDGVLRNYIPFYFDEVTNKKLPSFSFAVTNKLFGLKYDETALKKKNSFEYNKIEIPTFNPNSIFINYYGPSGTFKQINLIDVIDDKTFKTKTELEIGEDINTFDDEVNGLLVSNLFKDKIVLIGSVEPEDKDIFPVSIHPKEDFSVSGNLMYGVEVHANVVQMLIDKNFLKTGSLEVRFIVIFLLVFLGLNLFEKIRSIKFKYEFIPELINLIFVVFILYLIYEVYFFFFTKFNQIHFFIPPALGIVSAYIGSAIVDFLKERKQKILIKGMFSQYLNPELVNELVNNPEKLKLGGIRKNMTVLFSDLANFTTVSEKIEPEVLVEILNKYFDEMTEIIFETKGTLDKFEGDAVMAFWNAPIDDDKHHFHAALASLKMKRKFLELRNDWKPIIGINVSLRIGINSGEMIVGNMGGKKKFDYTVMGDNVNLAARLESINKIYGSDIIISEFVYDKIKEEFLTRELDLIIVKGKTVPVKIFQLIDLKNENFIYSQEEKSKLIQLIKFFESGLKYYREKKFLKAIEEFEKVLMINENDFPTKVFIERAKEFLNSPPPEDWNGVFESKIK
ncbi:MAG: adenylate/guanylate cyclase domain-containing protein [Ignavibacteria bacterium]|nr:adenylate/guanylate cyclase domain-containing protein [Ignavibacteria bacterium]